MIKRRWLTLLAGLSLFMGFVTYFLLSKVSVSSHGARTLTYVLLIDVACLILLTIVIAQRLTRIWTAKRQHKPGSILQGRMVILFGFIAGAPTLLVTFFSALFFHYGVEQWFDHKFAQGLDNATVIAQSYFEEQKDTLVKGLTLATQDLSTSVHRWSPSPQALEQYLLMLTALHGWQGISLYEVSPKGQELIMMVSLPNSKETTKSFLSAPFQKLPTWAQEIALQGDIAIMENTLPSRMVGILEIKSFSENPAKVSKAREIPTTKAFGRPSPNNPPRYFLVVVKNVSGELLEYAKETMAAATDYKILESRKLEIKIAFSVIFAFVSLLILLGAISVGLIVANAMARPIALLVEGAEKVARGKLSTVVTSPHADGDMQRLIDSFNTMVANLKTQQTKLIGAYNDLKERSAFIESLLAGVSSGVLELSSSGSIREHNTRALDILGLTSLPKSNPGKEGNDKACLTEGARLDELIPEAWPVFLAAKNGPKKYAEARITHLVKGHAQILYVRFRAEVESGDDRQDIPEPKGYVMTFDDLTAYLLDQRKAAWADVARRIAHEIKNPLTPIQLSAERLKRRCAPKLEGEDAEVFDRCIGTIIRQVETIGSMVNEFSGFARMPAATFGTENVSEIVKNSVALQQQAYPSFNFDVRVPKKDIIMMADGHQLNQILTNLLKNSIEAIDEMSPAPSSKTIRCSLSTQSCLSSTDGTSISGEAVVLTIEDSGPGWPKNELERLTEPYVTTRTLGTGLGLSIVARIIEEHSGTLELSTSPDLHGALVRVVIPKELGQTELVSTP